MDIFTFLTNLLGSYEQLRGGETLWSCPFCHHYKKKLAVKLPEGRWHCWVCEEKGSNLHVLLKKLNASQYQHKELAQILGESIQLSTENDVVDERIFLPKEYIPLWRPSKDFERKNALRYLKSRGITLKDIFKYTIGYCREGKYANRFVLPSYDENGQLNFFSTRAYYDTNTIKYLNPPGRKNKIIFYESHISWNLPIIICEGPLDAIAIRRNAIPLLGKTLSDRLREKIFSEKVNTIYLALDSDAIQDSLKLAEYFLSEGIKVYLVDFDDKDPADFKFEEIWKRINEANALTFGDIIRLKIDNI